MRFRNNRYITALDIQDRYVKCVQLRYYSHSWHIEKSARKEIPRPKNYDDLTNHVQTAHTIKSLLEEMCAYPPDNLVTCISGRDAAVRLLDLPPVGDQNADDVEGMIRYQLMLQLPVNMDQMGYDYQVTDEDDEGTKILTASAKRNVLKRHINILSLAGVYPDAVTTSSLALFNAFVGRHPESIKVGRTGLVCLRDSTGDVVICEDGKPVHARSFILNLNAGKEQLIRELHNSFASYSTSDTTGGAEEDGESETDGIQGNIRGERSHVSCPLSAVYLMTEDGQLPSEISEDDLHRITPATKWDLHPIGDDLAFGLALAGSRSASGTELPSSLRINLLKQILREKRADERKVFRGKLARMAPAIAIVVLLAISGVLWWQVREANDQLRLSRIAQQESKQQMTRVSQLGDTEKELEGQIDSLSWAVEDYPMVSYRLYQIARAIPDSLWLKEVSIPEQRVSKRKRNVPEAIGKLRVIGYAHEQEQIVEFLSALRGYDCFSDVIQESTSEVRLAGKNILEFQIGLTSRSGKTETRLAKAGVDR